MLHKKSQPAQNKVFPYYLMITYPGSRSDAAEYFMIMRNTDHFWFAGFTSRLLHSPTPQSGGTRRWAELTLSADWTAAPTPGLPLAADWTAGWQDGSMMWCQGKRCVCHFTYGTSGWMRGRPAAEIVHVWQETSLCGVNPDHPWVPSCSCATSRDDKTLPWQPKLCQLYKSH